MIASGFARLDSVMGGFSKGRTYTLYGPAETGKTSFCLSFLWQGLEHGENGVLVTQAKPEKLLAAAENFGMDLDKYLRSKQLRIFQYPENPEDAIADDSDLDHMLSEFQGLLNADPAERIVFDPITPLVTSQEVSLNRCRKVLLGITGPAMVTFFVVDSAKPDRLLAYCKDLAGSVLRFAPASKPGGPLYLRLERHPDNQSAEGLYPFQLVERRGLVEAHEPVVPVEPAVRPSAPRMEIHAPVRETRRPPSREVAPIPRPVPRPRIDNDARVLIVESDASHRSVLRSDLQRTFTVLEACGSMDAIRLLSAAKPRAIVLALDLSGESGIEVAGRFRQAGCALPIIGVSTEPQTLGEHVGALAAGVDVCLARPVDGRILRLTVFNAMCRQGSAPRTDQPVYQESDSANYQIQDFTSNLHTLQARLVREIAYSREQANSFEIVTMQLDDSVLIERLAELSRGLIGPDDSVFVGVRGVACFLTGDQAAAPFLSALWNEWRETISPQINQMRFDGEVGFLEAAHDFVLAEIGEPLPKGRFTAHAAAGAGPAYSIADIPRRGSLG